jgi:presenilin-like A22 family membrane protease
MTIHHLNKRDWKHIVDYETFWILSFSAVVLGSGIVALLSISLNNATSFP